MDLRKGLSFVAFGFLFTLVNFNLTFNGATVNVIPDFLGWILLFLAFDKLGTYVSDQKYLKWISLILIILSGAAWIFEIAKPELEIGILKTAVTVLSAVYMFLLFDSLERIARDYGSSREDTVRMLKIINPILLIGFVVAGTLAGSNGSNSLLGITAILGVCALAAAIVTAVVLFQLRKDISEEMGY